VVVSAHLEALYDSLLEAHLSRIIEVRLNNNNNIINNNNNNNNNNNIIIIIIIICLQLTHIYIYIAVFMYRIGSCCRANGVVGGRRREASLAHDFGAENQR
jgi:hypothetical protein